LPLQKPPISNIEEPLQKLVGNDEEIA
jgi:hypothetical protein